MLALCLHKKLEKDGSVKHSEMSNIKCNGFAVVFCHSTLY